MADFSSRESRKQELRRRLVDTALLQDEAAESDSSALEKHRTRKRWIIAGILVLLVLLISAAAVFLLRRRYDNYSVSWKEDITASEGAVESDYEIYEKFADGFLKVTRDGASYVNAAGKTIWNQAYEMNTPFVSVNGDFCAIADQGRTTLYIMDRTHPTGQAETNLPITKVAVSGTGVVYALLEDSEASYITVFTREGGALDITIKSILKGDGYPVDISVSPDGTELLASFAYIENGTIQNRVIFYNLDEVGQNAGSNRVVGGFSEDFRGHLCGRVHFTDNTHAQAFYDGGIAFFSTKILTSPELLSNVRIPELMRSIAWTDNYVGVVTDNASGSQEPYRLMVYRLNGQLVFEQPMSFPVESFELDGSYVLLSGGNSLRVYDMNGRIKYDGTIDQTVRKARIAGRSRSPFGLDVLIGSDGVMECLKLK